MGARIDSDAGGENVIHQENPLIANRGGWLDGHRATEIATPGDAPERGLRRCFANALE
jgi:hypothetical protein